jgi:hypothetical protein
MTNLPYREQQRLTAAWVWALVVALAAGAWVVFGAQLLGRETGGSPPPPWLGVLLLLLFGVGGPWLVWTYGLVVAVDAEELRIQFRPLWSRRVAIADIAEVEACTYRPLREYLGWGIRYLPGRGWAYTVQGNRGVRLRLHSGARILLGSRSPEQLAAAIEAARAGGGLWRRQPAAAGRVRRRARARGARSGSTP